MAATVKHFAAYGAPVAGREYNTVDMSTQQLFNDYLPPYKAAIDAGAATVMASFNSLDGVPTPPIRTRCRRFCVRSGASAARSSATTRRSRN